MTAAGPFPLAAEAPDLDVLTRFKGSIEAFTHHRGITHTFVGVPFIAALTIAFVWIIHRIQMRSPEKAAARVERLRRRGYPTRVRWGFLYLCALIAGFSHILLDYTNNYGVRPFEPFWYRWYSWDIVAIFEPLFYVVLIGGLVLPSLFRLVNEEIGAKDPRTSWPSSGHPRAGGRDRRLGSSRLSASQGSRRVAGARLPGRGPHPRQRLPVPANSVHLVWRRRDPRLFCTDAGRLADARGGPARQHADPLQARRDGSEPGSQVARDSGACTWIGRSIRWWRSNIFRRHRAAILRTSRT